MDAVRTIPITDATSAEESVVELPITPVSVGDVVECSVEITGALARAAYGMLSTDKFQGERRATITVNTAFDASETVTRAAGQVRHWIADPPPEYDDPPEIRNRPGVAFGSGRMYRPVRAM
jgi:hypothetical protein